MEVLRVKLSNLTRIGTRTALVFALTLVGTAAGAQTPGTTGAISGTVCGG